MRSLVQQDCGEPFAVIAVDDGSTDHTFDQLSGFARDGVTIRRQSNMGFTATLAGLCAEIDTPFIAIHGAGDESLPGRFRAQLAFLDAHPLVVAVGCGIQNIDELTGDCWDVEPPHPIAEAAGKGEFTISHGELMFRTDAYRRTGGYRPVFRVGQATDLILRLSRQGAIGYAAGVLYRRRLRKDGVNASPAQLAQRDILFALAMTVHAKAQGAKGATDDLDRYGLLTPYFLEPDRRVARGLSSAAVKYLMVGQRPIALMLARRSLAERLTLRGVVIWLAVFAAVGPFAEVFTRAVAALSKRTAENSLARLAKSHAKPLADT